MLGRGNMHCWFIGLVSVTFIDELVNNYYLSICSCHDFPSRYNIAQMADM